MTEAQLGKVERTNEALNRPDRIVRPNIILNPWRKQVRLIPALAGLECTIRHEQNRTSILEKAEFLPSLDGQITESCPAPFAKIFLFFRNPNHRYISRHPVPPGGALRNVTNAGRDAVDADRALDEGA
jgi:hypothetical protein